jgi:hypothetical protein
MARKKRRHSVKGCGADEPIVGVCAAPRAMADWLDHHLADVIHKYLSRASADVEAKV